MHCNVSGSVEDGIYLVYRGMLGEVCREIISSIKLLKIQMPYLTNGGYQMNCNE